MAAFVLSVAGGAWADDADTTPSVPPARQSWPPPARSPEIYDVRLAVDIPIILVAASTAVARAVWGEDLARVSCPCDPAEVNALDRPVIGFHSHAASKASDYTTWALMGGLPIADLLDLGFSRAMGQDLVVFLETLTVSNAVQNVVNFAVARPRPLAYANDPKFLASGEGYQSFYAGHVATAFAALSAASFTIQRRYGARFWPWIATAVIGASVAVERVAAGYHFPTDTIVGAAAGTTIGLTIPWLHLRASESSVPFTLGPGPGTGGLSLALRF